MNTFDVPIAVDGDSVMLPEYASEGAAGMDLRANIPSPITITPNERKMVPTGVRVALPQGLEGQVRPRSGIAVSDGISVINSPGTVDSDYRGEIQVILINLGSKPVEIVPRQRIAQLVIAPVVRVRWRTDLPLNDTTRGEEGFGHTGFE
jgi:dUTP pyrophosphatase